MNPIETIAYAGICFTPDCVIELEGQRPLVVVPRQEIKAIRLCYGFRARYPLLLAALGSGLIVLGLSQVPVIVHWIHHGGVLHVVQVLLVVTALFGGFTVSQAFRRGYLLVVDACNGRQMLEFSGVSSPSELETFLGEVQSRLGYFIER
jgi:hypothetical protein